MSREASIYLDLVRFTAAIVFMFGHWSGMRFTGGPLRQFGPFVSEAMVAFTERRKRAWRTAFGGLV